MYLISPPTYKDLDEEMRAYVKEVVAKIGYDPEQYSSHVTQTSSIASQRYYKGNLASFYVITFDRGFVERQNVRVKKAIAAHEVGHSFPECAALSRAHNYGMVTYLEKENCADVVSAVVFEYGWTLEALRSIKAEMPEAVDIDARISRIISQFGTTEEDLTPLDE